MRDAFDSAMASGDYTEAGRILKQYPQVLASIAKPDDPRSGLQPEAGAHLNAGSEPAHSTSPRPTPSAATHLTEGGGVGTYDPNPPSSQEVRQAWELETGLAQEAP